MALKLSFKINGIPSAISNANYRVEKGPFTSMVLVQAGSINIPLDGSGEIELTNTTGITAGDYLSVFVSDFTGTNYEQAGSAQDWIQVSDDGVSTTNDFSISVNANVVTISLWQGAPSSTVINWGDSYSNTYAENDEHEYAQGGMFSISVNGVSKTVTIASNPVYPVATSMIKLLPVGDSLTAQAQPYIYVGSSIVSDSSNVLYTRGAWAASAFVLCQSDYFFMDNMALSGEDTTQANARVEDIIAKDPDVYLVRYGTNDVNKNILSDSEIITSYTNFINALAVGDKKVLIIPAPHNNMEDGTAEAFNLRIDSLNASMKNYANGKANVYIAAESEEFKAFAASSPAEAFRDGLHVSDKGSFMEAVPVAESLDLNFPSRLDNKVSIFGGLTGSGGEPDGFVKFGALSWDGSVDRGDGESWFGLTLNGASNVAGSASSRLTKSGIPTEVGMYVGEVTVVVQNGEGIDRLALQINSAGSRFGATLITPTVPFVKGTYKDGTVFRFRTPACRMENSTAEIRFEARQVYGAGIPNAKIFYSNIELYKVSSIPVLNNIAYSVDGYEVTITRPSGSTGTIYYGDGNSGTDLVYDYGTHGTFLLEVDGYNASITLDVIAQPDNMLPTGTINSTQSASNARSYSFTASVVDGDQVSGHSLAWTTSDGQTSSSYAPTFVFPASGVPAGVNRTITCVITDSSGGQGTATKTILVKDTFDLGGEILTEFPSDVSGWNNYYSTDTTSNDIRGDGSNIQGLDIIGTSANSTLKRLVTVNELTKYRLSAVMNVTSSVFQKVIAQHAGTQAVICDLIPPSANAWNTVEADFTTVAGQTSVYITILVRGDNPDYSNMLVEDVSLKPYL